MESTAFTHNRWSPQHLHMRYAIVALFPFHLVRCETGADTGFLVKHKLVNGCDTTKIQLFCPNLLHNVANALGHKTNITNDRSSPKWLPVPSHTYVIPPNFRKLSILASDLYHDVRDCYCCLPFPSKLFTFPINLCLWEWLYLMLTTSELWLARDGVS